MLTVLFWGWIARRVRLRALFTNAYASIGLLTAIVATTTNYPLLGACFLVIAAAATGKIDIGDKGPCLWTGRPSERLEMTTVYGTYRDISRVASQGLNTSLLSLFPFTAIFVAGGGVIIVM